MGKIFKNMKLANKIYDGIKKITDKTVLYVIENKEKLEGVSIDEREITNLLLAYNLKNIKISKNGEISFKDKKPLEEKVEEVFTLLKTDKSKLFDRLYDFGEGFNAKNPKTSSKDDIFKALVYFRNSQGFSNNLMRNPDYHEKRYKGSLEGQKKHDALQLCATSVVNPWSLEFLREGRNISTMHYITDEYNRQMQVQAFEEDAIVNKFNSSVSFEYSDYLMGKQTKPSVSLTILFDSLVSDISKNELDPYYYRSFYENIATVFMNNEGDGTVCATKLGRTIDDVLYIDGVKLTDGLEMGDDAALNGKQKAIKLINAIIEGKSIEAVSTYNVNGKIDVIVNPVKFSLTKECKEILMDEYCEKNNIGWFHRTFFDWGPFKIKYTNLDDNFNKTALTESKEAKEERINRIIEDTRTSFNIVENDITNTNRIPLDFEEKTEEKESMIDNNKDEIAVVPEASKE